MRLMGQFHNHKTNFACHPQEKHEMPISWLFANIASPLQFLMPFSTKCKDAFCQFWVARQTLNVLQLDVGLQSLFISKVKIYNKLATICLSVIKEYSGRLCAFRLYYDTFCIWSGWPSLIQCTSLLSLKEPYRMKPSFSITRGRECAREKKSKSH